MSEPNKRIAVAVLEFYEGGNTLWVHGPEGGTVLRIKCTGIVKIKRDCQNSYAHADMMVNGDIEICMPGRRKRKPLAIYDSEDNGYLDPSQKQKVPKPERSEAEEIANQVEGLSVDDRDEV